MTYTQHVNLNWPHVALMCYHFFVLLYLLQVHTDAIRKVSCEVEVLLLQLLELHGGYVVGDASWKPPVAHRRRIQGHICACGGQRSLGASFHRRACTPVSRDILQQLHDNIPLRLFRFLGYAACLLWPRDVERLPRKSSYARCALWAQRRGAEGCHWWAWASNEPLSRTRLVVQCSTANMAMVANPCRRTQRLAGALAVGSRHVLRPLRFTPSKRR